jgi:ferredoxin-type protein NapH
MTVKKWTIARRGVQLGVIALIASPLVGLSAFNGNLAAGELLGIGLADPLAFLQATLASRLFVPSFLGAALLVTALYFATGGRSFCGWVCPVYLLTEMGDKLRDRLGFGERRFSLAGTRWTLAVTLIVSPIVGIPLFEILSPIGIATRAVMFKGVLPLLLPAAILLVEIFVARRIWCRSLCPAGGFYSLLGRFSPVRMRFSKERCTDCGDCEKVCPVEEVLAFPLRQGGTQVTAGDCTRCGKCIDVCHGNALKFGVGYR